MPRIKSAKTTGMRPKKSILTILGAAAAGQFFLAQPGHSWTLIPGILFMGFAFWKLREIPLPETLFQNKPVLLGLGRECLLLSSILAFALFFRIFRLNSIPPGLHVDQGMTGVLALRILHEHWRPFWEIFSYQLPQPVLFYQLACWFWIFGGSLFSFHLFFIFLSIGAFPLVYWTIRQWAGPRVALLSLFFLAVMRWNWIETRDGYPSLQVIFYLFGALAFFQFGLRRRRITPFIVSGLFCSLGFYTYQAFKIVPLLMILLGLFEWTPHRTKSKFPLRGIAVFFLVFTFFSMPLLGHFLRNHSLGNRERDLFIGNEIAKEKSLQPLVQVFSGVAFLFNRLGDTNPRHNLPDHRMLDDGTGALFLLGVSLAWRLRKQRRGFYPLAAFLTLSLTGFLSTDIAPSNRLVSLTPFVAYFAALAGSVIWKACRKRGKKFTSPFLAVFFLGAVTAQNYLIYFKQQAEDPRCEESFGLEQNFIGNEIAAIEKSSPNRDCFYVDPPYFGNHTVGFLSYPAQDRVFPFVLQDWAAGRYPKDKAAVIFLPVEKKGQLDFLRTLFPKMSLTFLKNPEGRRLIYEGTIPPEFLNRTQPWTRGLNGVYLRSKFWVDIPTAERVDPLLNFSEKQDFPFTQFPPFRIRWTGVLNIPIPGSYEFQILTTDEARLWIDGHPTPPEKPQRLSQGPHSIRLNYAKDSGDSMALSLLWKKPSLESWEVVPAEAFGKIKP